MTDEIPESVIRVLAAVRASGLCNMWDSTCVLDAADELGLDVDAIDWLALHTGRGGRYVEALKLMGQWRVEGKVE